MVARRHYVFYRGFFFFQRSFSWTVQEAKNDYNIFIIRI